MMVLARNTSAPAEQSVSRLLKPVAFTISRSQIATAAEASSPVPLQEQDGRRPQRPGNQFAHCAFPGNPPAIHPRESPACHWLCRNHSGNSGTRHVFAEPTLSHIVSGRNNKTPPACEKRVDARTLLWKQEENLVFNIFLLLGSSKPECSEAIDAAPSVRSFRKVDTDSPVRDSTFSTCVFASLVTHVLALHRLLRPSSLRRILCRYVQQGPKSDCNPLRFNILPVSDCSPETKSHFGGVYPQQSKISPKRDPTKEHLKRFLDAPLFPRYNVCARYRSSKKRRNVLRQTAATCAAQALSGSAGGALEEK
jgi:hypothetical protein